MENSKAGNVTLSDFRNYYKGTESKMRRKYRKECKIHIEHRKTYMQIVQKVRQRQKVTKRGCIKKDERSSHHGSVVNESD